MHAVDAITFHRHVAHDTRRDLQRALRQARRLHGRFARGLYLLYLCFRNTSVYEILAVNVKVARQRFAAPNVRLEAHLRRKAMRRGERIFLVKLATRYFRKWVENTISEAPLRDHDFFYMRP